MSSGTIAPPAAYLAPRATWYGPGVSARLAEGLDTFGAVRSGRVLVAADPALVEHGRVAPIVKALEAAGLEVTLVTDFGPELTSDQVDAAAEVGRASGVRGVVGVGGGSVLDAAKMISILLTNGGRGGDWYGVTMPASPRAPLVLVPTTVGTGAEVTRISMILDGGEKRIASSVAMVPDLVALDPELVVSLPPAVTAATALDALTHAAESFLSTASTPLTEIDSLAAIELVTKHLAAAYAGDATSKAQLLVAANRAGLALNAGVVLGHSLGYAVNHEQPMAHGATVGLSLPYTIAYAQNVESRKAELLALALTGGSSAQLRDAAEAVKSLVESVGLPSTLEAAGIRAGAEDDMAHRTVELYPRPTNPEPMDVPRVRRLLEAMRTGDLDFAFTITRTELS